MTRLLYLDQNYLSGIAKGKAAFFTGRRPDVLALRDRLAELTPEGEAA